MDEHVRIKQILPITEGFAVLTLGEDENGHHCFHDSAKDGWHYLFALVDGGKDADDYVAVYEMDATGDGDIDGCAYRIVPKRICPKCGRDTTPSWDVNDSWYPTYNCFCGYSFTQSQLKEGESK